MNENSSFFLLVVLFLALVGVGSVYWYSFRQKRRQGQSNAYLEALEYTVEGNDRLAIQKYKDAIREDSENVAAYIRLGDLLRKRGLLQNAIRIHKDLTLRGNLTTEQRIRILKSLLLDYELSADYEQAVSTARKILSMERNPELWIIQQLVDLYEKSNRWKDAVEIVAQHQKKLPPEYQSRIALYYVFQGLRLMEQGSGKDARVNFKEALKKDASCAAAYYYLGKSYKQEDRLEDAVNYWKKLCFNVPEKAYIVFPELEKAWFEMGRFADAESLYLEMMASGKNGLKPGLALTEIYSKKGDHESALEILRRLEDEYPDSTEVISQKVSVLFNKGQYKQAATQALTFFNKERENLSKVFRCRKCDFTIKEPAWVCPQCKELDTFI